MSYRKRQLEKLVLKVRDGWLRYSESFSDGAKLLAAAERMGLEGVVSKLWVNAYRSGPRCDWIKVKCSSWREANWERWRSLPGPSRVQQHALTATAALQNSKPCGLCGAGEGNHRCNLPGDVRTACTDSKARE